MATVLIDNKSSAGDKLLEYVKNRPHIKNIMDKLDNTPLPVSEDELLSLEEFGTYMKKLAHERLGIRLTL